MRIILKPTRDWNAIQWNLPGKPGLKHGNNAARTHRATKHHSARSEASDGHSARSEAESRNPRARRDVSYPYRSFRARSEAESRNPRGGGAHRDNRAHRDDRADGESRATNKAPKGRHSSNPGRQPWDTTAHREIIKPRRGDILLTQGVSPGTRPPTGKSKSPEGATFS
jgi:hypothetical protein